MTNHNFFINYDRCNLKLECDENAIAIACLYFKYLRVATTRFSIHSHIFCAKMQFSLSRALRLHPHSSHLDMSPVHELPRNSLCLIPMLFAGRCSPTHLYHLSQRPVSKKERETLKNFSRFYHRSLEFGLFSLFILLCDIFFSLLTCLYLFFLKCLGDLKTKTIFLEDRREERQKHFQLS